MATTGSSRSTGNSDVTLSLRSRYRNTRVRKDDETKIVFFGIWRPPVVEETRPPKRHRISPDEIHRPDLISHREYGDPNLFWAIAIRNNMLFPFLDIKKHLLDGSVLMIPHIDDVMAALQRSSPNSPSRRV